MDGRTAGRYLDLHSASGDGAGQPSSQASTCRSARSDDGGSRSGEINSHAGALWLCCIRARQPVCFDRECVSARVCDGCNGILAS